MCLVTELLFHDVFIFIHIKKPIPKESRKFYKFLRTLVLEKEKNQYSEKGLFRLHIPVLLVLFITSPGIADEALHSDTANTFGIPPPPRILQGSDRGAQQHILQQVCLRLARVAESGLQERRAAGSGSPSASPLPWPQPACLTLGSVKKSLNPAGISTLILGRGCKSPP